MQNSMNTKTVMRRLTLTIKFKRQQIHNFQKELITNGSREQILRIRIRFICPRFGCH